MVYRQLELKHQIDNEQMRDFYTKIESSFLQDAFSRFKNSDRYNIDFTKTPIQEESEPEGVSNSGRMSIREGSSGENEGGFEEKGCVGSNGGVSEKGMESISDPRSDQDKENSRQITNRPVILSDQCCDVEASDPEITAINQYFNKFKQRG